MISQEHPLASWFLAVSAFFFLLVYALPLFLMPLRWARWFRWEPLTGNPDLAVYFGRCLGAAALAIIWAAFSGMPDPRGHRVVFELIGAACGLLTVVHIWGAIQRTQPWTETAEIVMYAAVTGMAFWLRTTLV